MPQPLKQALDILLSCALAYSLASLVPLAAGYWALITAIAVSNSAFSQTLQAGINQIIGTILGGIVGIAVIVGKEHGLATGPLFVAGLIPLAALTGRWPSLRMCCTTLVILVLIPAQGSPFVRAYTRFVEILIGSVSAVAVTRVLSLTDPRQPGPKSPS